MTLRRKTFLILATTSVASLALSFIAAESILSRGLERIEENFARDTVRQAKAVWVNTLDNLDLVAADWAAWDDSCDFVNTLNPAYIKSSLPVESLVNVGINAIAYFNSSNKLVFSRQVDVTGRKEIPLSKSLARHLQPGSPLLNHGTLESSAKGVLLLPEGPVLVASRPIIRSDKTGPSQGTLVMVRSLDGKRIAALRKLLIKPPQIFAVTTPNLPPESRAALSMLCAGASSVLQRPSQERLSCYELVRDLYGEPALLVRIDLPRDVYLQGQSMIHTLLISLLIASIVASIILVHLLGGSILSRVHNLCLAARGIAASKDVSRRVPTGDAKDELADLGCAFNEMLAALQATEQEMSAARESAEIATRMKSRFVANVSHEIRTPLNCIIGFAETILARQCPPHVHHSVETILQESEVLLALINDLLDEAKIEAGKLELESRPFELGVLLDGTVEAARTQAHRKALTVTAVVGEDVPHVVVGDSLRLRQVLMNLLSNAVKFTEQGSVTLSVDSELPEGGRQLRFSVTDTGIGIPRERQKAIFESFVQADAGTSREYGGTGLGTTIARQLVKLMGGQIGVESTPGKGSTFWFTLPCQTPSSGSGDVTADEVERPACALRKGRILLVEDYPASREVARMHLERAGHAVTAVESGQEALSACEAFAFDLILMDVQMPGMDGTEATMRIRSSEMPAAAMPILGLTADVEGGTRKACLQAGMDDVIFKPIRRNTLLAAVSRWLTHAADSNDQETNTMCEPQLTATATVLPLDYEAAIPEFGNKESLDQIAEHFLGELEGNLRRIRQALAQGDIAALRALCHSIKGGAATLMAAPLAEQARRLEQLDATDTQRLSDGVAVLRQEVERLKEYVHTHTRASQESESHA